MKFSTFKNLLAALGAVFMVVLLLSLIIALTRESSSIGFGDKVAVVDIEGVITDSIEINEQIAALAKRDDVKVVVLRINSPGGGVAPSQEIYREVSKLRDIKKVVVSMGAVAASGGYYIAAAADWIVANPGTITGSIGVIMEFVNIEGLFDKLGLKGNVIKSGKFKDVGSPLRDMEKEEREMLQGLIDDVHRQFVEAVAAGRSMELSEISKIADGRIILGEKALEIGLVDSLGNLSDAIDLAAELVGIEGEPTVIYPSRKSGVFDNLLGKTATVFNDLLPVDLTGGLRLMYIVPNLSS